MKKQIGAFILKLGRWKEEYPKGFGEGKCVMISAPHTSAKDYIYTIASFWKQGIDVSILSVNSEKISLLTCFLNKLIGNNLCKIKREGVEYSVNLFSESNKLILIFPTESNRKKVDSWRTEFYDVAYKAKVPIAIGFLDYSDKIMGVCHLFSVSGNKEQDLQKIGDFYKNFTPKFPENYNTKIY